MNISEFKRLYENYDPIRFEDNDIEVVNNAYKDINIYELMELSEEVDLSLADAILDTEQLFLILKYCYSGYEFHNEIKDFNSIKEDIITNIKNLNLDVISNLTLAEVISKELKKYVNDGHLGLQAGNNYFKFIKLHLAYVTGVIVEEFGDSYRVIKGNKQLAVNSILQKKSVEGKLLPTISVLSNNKCYLIGIHSDEKIKSINVDGIDLKTRLLHSYKYEYESPDYILKFNEYDNYNILKSKKYAISENYRDYLKQFNEMGAKSRNKKITVFDVAGNRGGWSAYPEEFIKGLNEYSHWKTDVAIIKNDAFKNAKNEKQYEIILNDAYDTSKGKYEGTLYVVMNKWTASSGEAAVEYAKSCRNVIFVGSDTAGVGLFGDIRGYLLSRSKMVVLVPYKVFLEEGKDEGKGSLPDYWIDSKNPTRYLEKWLKHNNIV